MRYLSALCGIAFILNIPLAHAQVQSNFAAGGGLRIGWSSTACSGTIPGALRFNSGSGGSIDFCNGTTWQSVGGGGSIDALSDAITNYPSANMFLGQSTGATITTGAGNTSLGFGSMYNITSGNSNTAFGEEALTSLSTGQENTAVGRASLYATNGSGNTAIGAGAMANAYNATANGSNENTAVGAGSLQALGEKYRNTAIGQSAGAAITTGSENTLIGNSAGDSITTGDYNIVIGSNADTPSPTLHNRLNIGNLIYGDMSASKFMGVNTPAPAYTLHVTGDIAYTGITIDVSDMRRKDDIAPLPPALSQIMALKPVSFTMKNDPLKRVEYGFIAQDVQKLYPVLVETADDADKTLSMNYIGMIAPLVKAVQEQQVIMERQQAQIDELMQALKDKAEKK